jgi:methyl-accepting chemotaxis protein
MTTYSVSTPTSAKSAEEAGLRDLWILGRRRRISVPGGWQWRTVALVGGLTLTMLIALDVALIRLVLSGSSQVIRVAPELRHLLVGQDRDLVLLIVLGSIVTFVGVLAMALLETHRTAGPVHKLARTLEHFASDGPQTRLRLRRDDHFLELERAFNAMAAELEARSLRRVAELARITAQVRQTAEGGCDAETQAQLRALAFDLQKLGEDVERR